MKRGRLTYPILMTALLIAASLVRHWDPPQVERARLIAFDTLQRWSPRAFDPATPVRIVDIDEASLTARGQWPWPRTEIAALIEKLEAAGAVAIAFDMVFAEPDRLSPAEVARRLPETPEAQTLKALLAEQPDNDAVLGAAVAKSGVVMGFVGSEAREATPPAVAEIEVHGDDPRRFVPHFPGAIANLPVLTAGTHGSGFINWIAEHDQIIRKLPLLLQVGETLYPSMAAEALRLAQGISNYLVVTSGSAEERAFGASTGIVRVHIGNAVVPTDANGQVWLHFTPSDPRRYLSATKVLDGSLEPDAVKGKIVVVGTSAAGLLDVRATPLNPAMPGVEAHAQAIEQMLSGEHLVRPDFATGAETVFVWLVGIILAVAIARSGALLGFVLGTSAVVVVGAVCITSYLALGWLFDPVFPCAALGGVFLAGSGFQYLRTEGDRNRVRTAFGHYMAPALVEKLAADPSRLVLGGENRDLTILFADVRGFTRRSEGLDAQALTAFVIELFSPVSNTILAAGGTIDKYIGNSVMAFWNAPLDQPDHPRLACRAALRMLDDIAALNRRWDAEAKASGKTVTAVSMGIGINSGVCCVGNFGSETRFDYSALGDDVNLASRLEGLTKFYGVPIMLGERTARAVEDLAILELDFVKVRGYQRAVHVFALLGDETLKASPAFSALQQKQVQMLAAFRSGRFDDALALVDDMSEKEEKLQSVWDIYRRRIGEWKRTPPPATWDGSMNDTSS